MHSIFFILQGWIAQILFCQHSRLSSIVFCYITARFVRAEWSGLFLFASCYSSVTYAAVPYFRWCILTTHGSETRAITETFLCHDSLGIRAFTVHLSFQSIKSVNSSFIVRSTTVLMEKQTESAESGKCRIPSTRLYSCCCLGGAAGFCIWGKISPGCSQCWIRRLDPVSLSQHCGPVGLHLREGTKQQSSSRISRTLEPRWCLTFSSWSN